MNKGNWVIILSFLTVSILTTISIEFVQAAPSGFNFARIANEVLIDINDEKQFGQLQFDHQDDSYFPINGCSYRHSLYVNNLESTIQKMLQIKDANQKQFDISILSLNKLQEYFQELKSNNNIPFGYPEDGCYARAHEMSMILDKKGITTGKVFIEGDLRVDTNNSPKGYVEWWYHVAPIVFVNQNNKLVPYVLGPSLFDKAVPLSDWTKIQTKHNPKQNETVYFTKRYNYTPWDKSLDLQDYNQNDIISGKSILQSYLKIQQKREKKRLEELQKKKRLEENLNVLEDFFNSTDLNK